MSLLKVSKLLGHAEVKMTRKYAHLSPDATGREAMDILDQTASINSTEGDDPKRPAPEFMNVGEDDHPKPEAPTPAAVSKWTEGDHPKRHS